LPATPRAAAHGAEPTDDFALARRCGPAAASRGANACNINARGGCGSPHADRPLIRPQFSDMINLRWPAFAETPWQAAAPNL